MSFAAQVRLFTDSTCPKEDLVNGIGKPNPALNDLAPLVGEWVMEISQAKFLPSPQSTATGRAVVEWVGDSALILRQFGDGDDAATWIIGRDESEPEYTVFYYDVRGSSRVYRMTFTGREWQIWRDRTAHPQRYIACVEDDTITGEWQDQDANGEWVHDFSLTYRRSGS